MSRPCSPEAACERAFYPETMVRKVVDFHDAITAFWQGLVLDRGILREFKAWQHESYRELVLSGLHWGMPVIAGKPVKRPAPATEVLNCWP